MLQLQDAASSKPYCSIRAGITTSTLFVRPEKHIHSVKPHSASFNSFTHLSVSLSVHVLSLSVWLSRIKTIQYVRCGICVNR